MSSRRSAACNWGRRDFVKSVAALTGAAGLSAYDMRLAGAIENHTCGRVIGFPQVPERTTLNLRKELFIRGREFDRIPQQIIEGEA